MTKRPASTARGTIAASPSPPRGTVREAGKKQPPRVAVKITVAAGDWPDRRKLTTLAKRAISAAQKTLATSDASPSELSLVFTDDPHMRKLNKEWRGKDSPTNVLSFPQAGPTPTATSGRPAPAQKSRKPAGSEESARLLGDVILSAETVAREAALARKPLVDHMAHLIIHGYLHLLGFDHEGEADAEKMEQLERVALRALGIPDPYAAASVE